MIGSYTNHGGQDRLSHGSYAFEDGKGTELLSSSALRLDDAFESLIETSVVAGLESFIQKIHRALQVRFSGTGLRHRLLGGRSGLSILTLIVMSLNYGRRSFSFILGAEKTGRNPTRYFFVSHEYLSSWGADIIRQRINEDIKGPSVILLMDRDLLLAKCLRAASSFGRKERDFFSIHHLAALLEMSPEESEKLLEEFGTAERIDSGLWKIKLP